MKTISLKVETFQKIYIIHKLVNNLIYIGLVLYVYLFFSVFKIIVQIFCKNLGKRLLH